MIGWGRDPFLIIAMKMAYTVTYTVNRGDPITTYPLRPGSSSSKWLFDVRGGVALWRAWSVRETKTRDATATNKKGATDKISPLKR